MKVEVALYAEYMPSEVKFFWVFFFWYLFISIPLCPKNAVSFCEIITCVSGERGLRKVLRLMVWWLVFGHLAMH